jgi:hypothetical protein
VKDDKQAKEGVDNLNKKPSQSVRVQLPLIFFFSPANTCTVLRQEGSRKLDGRPTRQKSCVHCRLQAGSLLRRRAICCAFAVVLLLFDAVAGQAC